MPFLFVSVIFIAFARIFTRRAALQALEAKKSCFFLCDERIKNKTKGIMH